PIASNRSSIFAIWTLRALLTMERETELNIGRSIRSIMEKIRAEVFLNGRSTRWHTGKAGDALKNDELRESLVPLEDKDEIAQYLKELPSLIERTRAQGEMCAKLW